MRAGVVAAYRIATLDVDGGGGALAGDDLALDHACHVAVEAGQRVRRVEHLGATGVAPARAGLVGFCMGGSVALSGAARLDLGAAVTFYGGGVSEGRFGFGPLVEEATRLRAPWLGL
ncbi:MAG: hypothetical protein GEU88_20750, partial [Solirubrobacterales bacterium]|nr:hypothetical protein [Solirubrobacterales bacterium]